LDDSPGFFGEKHPKTFAISVETYAVDDNMNVLGGIGWGFTFLGLADKDNKPGVVGRVITPGILEMPTGTYLQALERFNTFYNKGGK